MERNNDKLQRYEIAIIPSGPDRTRQSLYNLPEWTENLVNKVNELGEENLQLRHKDEKLETALAELLVEVKELKEKVAQLEAKRATELVAQIQQPLKK